MARRLVLCGVAWAVVCAVGLVPAALPSHPGLRDKAPAWSPDGRFIAFTRAGNDFDEIWVAGTDGTRHRKISRGPARDTQPTWSPDGRRIAFASTSGSGWDIYLMDADGSDRVRLTSHPADDTAPAWSPDGSRLAYQRRDEASDSSEIRVVRADGSSDRLLTAGARNESPSWSPDGSRIVFQSNRDGTTRTAWDLYVMDADGGGVRQLLATPGRREDEPSWSPDGSRIAFAAGGDVVRDIYVIDADGSSERRVTKLGRPVWRPRWSPDGRRLAFFEFPFPEATIYIVQADGSGLTRLFGSLQVVGLSLRPKRPVAGRSFAAELQLAGAGSDVRVNCRATVAGRALRTTGRRFAAGRARCSWSLPRATAGRRLGGSIAATERGSTVTRRFSVLIRS